MKIASVGNQTQTVQQPAAQQPVRQAQETSQINRRLGTDFLSRNPDQTEDGVVMALSREGRNQSAKMQEARRTQDEGSVKVKEEAPGEKAREAAPSVEDVKNHGHKTLAQEAAAEEKAAQEKAAERTVEGEKEAAEKVSSGEGAPKNTANLQQYSASDLRQMFLDGDISLKKYKEETDSRNAKAAEEAMMQIGAVA